MIISQYLPRKLKLKGTWNKIIGTNNVSINTFGTTKATPIVETGIILNCGFAMKLQANVVPEVTGKIERWPIEFENIKVEIMKYELTDNLPTTTEMSRVGILIGNDYYIDTVSMKRIEITDTLHLLGLRIGWTLTGRTKTNEFINKNLMMLTNPTSISSKFEAFQSPGKF